MKLLSQFESQGNIELLSQNIIAVFSSKDTPKEIYLEAQRVFEKLKEMPLSIAGGWQAPLEKRLLETTNSKMKANIIFYTALDLSQIKMGQNLKSLYGEKKLLFISAQSKQKRVSKTDVDRRDELLFKQVNQVLFLYISPRGRLEKYFNQMQTSGFPIFMLHHSLNERFLISGCPSIQEENVDELL